MHSSLALNLYRELLDNSSDPIFSLTPDFRYLYANQAFANGIGRSLDEIVGHTLWDIFPKDQADMRAVVIKSVLDHAETRMIETRVKGLGGERDYLTTVKPIFGDQGQVILVLANSIDITERKRLDDALKISEERWKLAIEGAGDGLWDWNVETGLAWYSSRYKEMFGCADADFGDTAEEWIKRIHPDDAPGVLASLQPYMDGKPGTASVEFRMLCKDGSWKWTLGRGTVVSRNSKGQTVRLVGVNTDISERKRMEEALREQKEFFHLIAENIGGFLAVLDCEGRRLYNSPSYQKLFGNSRDLCGTDSFAEIHPQDREHVKQVFRETVRTGTGCQIYYRLMLSDGSIREMESLGSVIHDSRGKVAKIVVMSHDITERKQKEDEVHQLAFNDPLTRLPNRRLLHDRLSQAMASNKRSGCYGAVMFLDLDDFKALNDRHGHDVGDVLLIQAANRLKVCVRETDTVARFGGDEFVVVLSELDADRAISTTQVGVVAEKIRATLAEPYQLIVKRDETGDTVLEYHCTASIGVTLFVKQQHGQDEILKLADAAMYQAKAAGRNAIRFYDLPA